MSTATVWVEAARPRTLPAAVAPVVVGTAAVGLESLWRALAALVVALAVQVAVNYANDYSDGVRGVDTEARVGPRRAVASGLVAPSAMRRAIVVALGVSAAAGIALAAATTWWLVAVGAVCFLAALGYSGGPKPYASAALGELFVFVFFGLVATVGSAFVQVERLDGLALVAAVPVGLLAVAILVANNLRDIFTDAEAGKMTLAVRLGEPLTRALYGACTLGAIAALPAVAATASSFWPLLGAVAILPAIPAVQAVMGGAVGGELIRVLGMTARTQMLLAVGLAAGLWLVPGPAGVIG